jgi:hypothetical protein
MKQVSSHFHCVQAPCVFPMSYRCTVRGSCSFHFISDDIDIVCLSLGEMASSQESADQNRTSTSKSNSSTKTRTSWAWLLVDCAGEDGSEVKCAVRLGETGNPDLSGEGRRCGKVQLAVNDAFNDPAVKEIMDLALRIREPQGWEYPVVTRWNSKYDLLCRVWLGKAVVTPTFNDKTLGSLKMLTDALSPFASATDAVQSDRATVFDWATIFAQLSKIEAKSRFAKILRQCFLQRHDKLLSDALLLCWFH